MSFSGSSANSGSSTPVPNGSSRPKTYRHQPYALNLMVAAPENSVSTPVSGRRCSVNVHAGSYLDAFDRCDAASTPRMNGMPPSPSSQTSVTSLFNTVIPPHTPISVTFKYGKKCFEAAFTVQVGDAVVVEGDRGIDYGVVEGHAHVFMPGNDQSPLKVLRLARAADDEAHRKCIADEKSILEHVRTLATQVDCTANIQDVMLQLDGKKITVVITRDTRPFVDFRRLQRAAYDAYRCRVWFSYLDEIAETMSTEVTQPLRRAAHNNNSPQAHRNASEKKRHANRRNRRAETVSVH